MNFKKLILLIAGLSIGSAGAASLAGTTITNQANATFTVGGVTQTTNSTIASTVVNAVPSYTITNNGTEAAPAYFSNVAVEAPVTYNAYTITNTGNTFLQVNLGATYGTGSSAISAVTLNGQNVTTVAAGNTPTSTTTTATLAPGATLNLTESFTTPTLPGVYYTAPVGVSINYSSSAVDSNNVQLSTPPATMDVVGQALADTDNVNRTTVTTTTPTLGGPDTTPGDGSTITNPTTPTPVPTPGAGGPGNTTPGTGTGTPGSGNGPGESSGPGYVTTQPGPGGSGVPVVVDGNSQYAFPKADTNSTADSVTMTATVGNPNPVASDYVLNPGPNYTFDPTSGTWIGKTGTPAEGTTVTFRDANGNPLPCTASGCTLTVPENSTANYQTVITYPDSESASAKTAPISVPVTVNGAGPQTFVVMPPNLSFGNANGAAGVDSAARAVALIQPSVLTCVVFPMDVANTGTYAEAYSLSATTTVPGGSVKYVSSVPNATTTARLLNAADCATVTNAAAITGTPAIAAGAEQTVYAVVSVPAGVAAATYALNQQATGNYSGTIKTFNTDTVTVDAVSGSGLTLSKAVDKANANPGDLLTYTVNATNNYNTSLYGLILKDPSSSVGTGLGSTIYTASNVFGANGFLIPTTLSATASGVAGKVLYRVNGGSWSDTAPTVNDATTSIEVGVDTNSDTTIDLSDIFPVGATITVTLQGTVK